MQVPIEPSAVGAGFEEWGTGGGAVAGLVTHRPCCRRDRLLPLCTGVVASLVLMIFLAGRSSSADENALGITGSGEPSSLAQTTSATITVGAAGNANAFPFTSDEDSLYERYAHHAAAFNYYPLPGVSDYDMAGAWTDAGISSGVVTGPGANIDSRTSLTAAHFYNAVVYILLRYFNFTPSSEDDITLPWQEPRSIRVCQPPMANCGDKDMCSENKCTQQMQADYRIRPTICCHGTGHLDFAAVLNVRSSVTLLRTKRYHIPCR